MLLFWNQCVDVLYLLCFACRVIVLEDNDVLHMVGGGYGIYNTRQADVETAVPRQLQVLQMEVDQIMKVSRSRLLLRLLLLPSCCPGTSPQQQRMQRLVCM
jgi:glucosamine 6-phosphate synthetase-like amidotransferase/phosphosugar isomerase protein